jgi:hypothetical protein
MRQWKADDADRSGLTLIFLGFVRDDPLSTCHPLSMNPYIDL